MSARALFLALFATLVSGCATDPFGLPVNQSYRTPVELRHTPFFPQEKYQCGPAALATVLASSGVGVHPDELISKVYIPDRRGSLQAELLAASRDYGRMPYVIPPEFPALLAEVEHGRPVLVLQNLGVKLFPVWHYAVVVGFMPEQSQVVLRSGTDKRRVTDAGVFIRTWNRSNNWGFVALQPGELPVNPVRHRYLKAAAAAESSGHLDLATAAYAAASGRWPESALAWFGLGNAAYGRGDIAKAEHWYRRALEVDPHDAATLNNLATAVAGQGRCTEAAELIAAAMELPDTGSAIAALLAESQAEIGRCRTSQ